MRDEFDSNPSWEGHEIEVDSKPKKREKVHNLAYMWGSNSSQSIIYNFTATIKGFRDFGAGTKRERVLFECG